MNLRTFAAPILGSFLTVLVLSAPCSAVDIFARNDVYDFRGVHAFWIGGPGGYPTPDDFTVGIESDTDFRLFKLRVTAGMRFAHWTAQQVKVDMDNDGTWELVTWPPGAVVTFMYPEPSGLSETHTVRFEIKFIDMAGQEEIRTAFKEVTIFPAPRVYYTGQDDAFIQVRNEDPTNKIPILIVEGFDPLNDMFPEWYYDLLWDLINNDAYPAGFEVFLLNFGDGGTDLRQNAFIVSEALEKIHEICPNSEIALVGLSMGGTVSRYALAKAEDQEDAHHVGLFVSFDSPQQKAHVSPELQGWIAGENPNEGAIGYLQAALQSVAAKQMLGYNTYDPAHVFHDQFYNQLNALNGDGYPHRSFNGAISNGNFVAKWGYESEGQHLVTLRINSQLFRDVTAVPFDCGTGSLTPDIRMRRYGDIFNNPFLHVWYELEILFNPVFIPTWSALDLQGFDINDVTGDLDIPGSSKFDDFAVQPTTLMHHELSQTSRTKILSWLNRTSDFTVNFTLLEGGTTGPDVFPVTILRNTPITISPKTVTVNGTPVTYDFANWDDGNTQNPRYFYASHDAAKAVSLKGHRLTMSSGATWASNARRITADFDWVGPTYHAVYESDGTIWHLRNRRSGGWEPERAVSVGSGQASNPTITTHSWGHDDQIEVYVAWVENGYVKFRASNVDNGLTWQDVRSIPSGMASSVILPDPYGVIWADGAPGYAGIYYYKMPETNNTWECYCIPGTEGNSSSPAACASSGCRYELAFIRDGRVYVEGFSDPNPLDGWVPPTVCSPAVDITSTGWTASNPTIADNNGTICVAWEETYGTYHRIAYRERSGATWFPTRYFTHSSDLVSKPVLAIDWGCDTVNLLWECGGSIARVTRPRTGTVWAGIEHIGAGRAPSIVASSSYKTIPMWVSGASAPYSIQLAGSLACSSPPPPPPPGCPILFVHGADGWRQENSILGRSPTGTMAFDACPLSAAPAARGGRYGLRIQENEQETTTLDGAALVAIDHSASVRAFRTGEEFVLRTRQAVPQVLTNTGMDVTALVSGSDGTCFSGGPGDTLSVTLAAAKMSRNSATEGSVELTSGGDGILIELNFKPPIEGKMAGAESSHGQTDAESLGSTGVLVEIPDGAGGWREAAHIYPRESFSPFVVDSVGSGPVRLAFLSRHNVRFIGRLTRPAERPVVRILRPTVATHSRLGSVLQAAQGFDGATTEIVPGDTLSLSFLAMGDPTPGQEREWFLLTRGVYTSVSPKAPESPDPHAGDWRFVLGPAWPQPAAGELRIGYTLAEGAQTTLRIYDVSGRLVRRLVEGAEPAGSHEVVWDTCDEDGRRLPQGVYFYRLTVGNWHSEKKLILVGE